jgi:hypothetical protein
MMTQYPELGVNQPVEIQVIPKVNDLLRLCGAPHRRRVDTRGFSELESLVGIERIISQTIVTPDQGSRRPSERVNIADSVALSFLTDR